MQEIVIKISEEEYKCVQITGHIGNTTQVSNAIYTGALLPKNHGRLIDANVLSFRLNEAQIEGTDIYKGLGEAKQIVEDAPTIIEADEVTE